MTVLAFAAAGAGVGSLIGGTFLGVSAAGWGWSLGAFFGNVVQGGPAQHHEGPQYTDSKVFTSAYGRTVGRVWGTYPVIGNVIWKTPLRKVAHTRSQRIGGFLGIGGSKVSTTTYEHFVDVAILLCEGPIIGVPEIKFNGSVKYNVDSSASSADVIASALNARAVRIHDGSESQDVDPLIYAHEGANTSAYRGYAYMVLEGLEVTEYGGHLPQIEAKVVAHGSAAPTLAISAGTVVGTTSVIHSTPGFQLGRNGDLYALGAVSNTAVRVNFYAGAVQTVYTRTLWGYNPIAVSSTGEGVYNNAGGFFGLLKEDGSVEEYTSAPTGFGSGGSFLGVQWIDATSGFAQGGASSSNNLYRFTLDTTANTVEETLLTAARSTHLFQNATRIDGRCYCYGSTAFSHDLGYITDTNAKVLLFTGTEYAAYGLLISRDDKLWLARINTSTDVEVRDPDGTLLATITIPSGTVQRLFESPDGYIWACVGGGAVYGIHPTLYTIDFTSVNVGTKVPIGFTEDNRLIFYSISGSNVSLHEMEPIPRVTTGSVAASTVVGDICAMVGLEAADLNVAALTDDVPGYGVFRRMAARAMLEPVLAFCRAELVESDDKIKAVKRTGAVVATIDADDLGAYEDGETPPAAYTARRINPAVLPWELVVEHPDIDAGYELNAQPARRWTRDSTHTEQLPITIAMSAQSAMRLAETALDDRWVARMVYGLRLPRPYARLEPTDVIRVPGIDKALRIVADKRTRGVLELECVADSDAAYASTASGVAAPEFDASVTQAGPTVLRILDIPLLIDSHDASGFYVAACGYFAGWNGAELYVSADAGATYSRLDVPILEAAVIGSAVTALANWSGGEVHDETNALDVQVISGTPPASGTLLCGSEILEYQARELIATNKWRFTSLRRGRKGTEGYMAAHAVGENVVVLDLDTIVRITTASTEIGAERLYKAVSFGQHVNDAAPVAFTLAGVGLEPYAAVNLRAGRTANASWDILIDWDRRTRVGGEWRNNVEASLGEASESYEVEIYSSSAFTTLKRTLTPLSSSTATYSSANQVTDFGSNQTTIYVRIYQLSATVGRGFVAQGTLTV